MFRIIAGGEGMAGSTFCFDTKNPDQGQGIYLYFFKYSFQNGRIFFRIEMFDYSRIVKLLQKYSLQAGLK